MANITERPVDASLKTLLVDNKPFLYAHLVKFERPSRPDDTTGLVSTSAQRYAYFTDGSINIAFDDGSIDLDGNPNGSQTYLANKVLSVGQIQEQTTATSSTTSLVIDGNALGAEISGTVDIASAGTGLWDITWDAPVYVSDLIDKGFREGDKVFIDNRYVNIHSFRGTNVLRVSKIDVDMSVITDLPVTMTLASEEIISVLLNKNSADYASFINREVFIYRAYYDEDGTAVGTPILLFKGIIHSVNFDDSEDSIKVSWGLTSHWGDFTQVRGRVTADGFHRALDANGIPQPDSALKPEYAYDKGFIHAETSVNVLANYTVTVEKQDVKYKKGVLGIGSKVKVKTYTVQEGRTTKLDFNIQAKSLPVIYGVRKTEGINIFADTLNSDSSTVFVAQALCEGEIAGIYDIYIDGNSLICNDKQDFDARSTQTSDNTVEIVCRGRADRGDVLGGASSVSETSYQYFNGIGEEQSISDPYIYNYIADWYAAQYTPPVQTIAAQSGVIDGESIKLTSPQNVTLDFFSGRPGQKASAQLSDIAYNKNFKIQNSYWNNTQTAEYWGPNHRLLDTAYIVGKILIEEGETTIPDVSYIVRGKVIDCYNYDYSYLHDAKETGESASNFSLGDIVTLHRSDNDLEINAVDTVQIIDKWNIINPDGSVSTRFRFNVEPALNYDANGVPAVKSFYMKKGVDTWTMLTWNYETLNGVVPGPISVEINAAANDAGNLQFTYAVENVNMAVSNSTLEPSAKFTVRGSDFGDIASWFSKSILVGLAGSTTITTEYPYASYAAEAASIPAGSVLASKNTIRLPVSASAVTDYYKGYLLEVSRIDPVTGKKSVQVAEIEGYNGTSKIATISDIFNFIPDSGDSVVIYPKWRDGRVSINPAIITLDYITSKTYGKGLDIYREIDLPSWQESARLCDSRSNVTMLCTTSLGTVAEGDVYKYETAGGVLLWQGTVFSKDGSYATFTDNLGKITNKWNSWKTFNTGEIIYNNAGNIYRVNSTGTLPTEPTHQSGSANGATYISSLALTKVSGAGPATINLNLTRGNPVQALLNGQKISGYSIYDCDDITYWKYIGWDEHSQRSVTRNQCNVVIDTAEPLSENINALLAHFNGILRYTGGKYYLDVETTQGAIDVGDVRTITDDEIIGRVTLSDEGSRSAFNSLTAAFSDPANKFEPRSIGFFNSDYLKADRNVPKKGNLSVGGITNYYNTRLLADTFLNKSRFGMSISFTMRPKGILILAGSVIQVIYSRYDWDSPGKKFSVEAVKYRPDGLVDIVAKEYDDSFYAITNIKGEGGHSPSTPVGQPVNTGIAPPTELIVTSADTFDELLNGVELFWKNAPAANSSSVYTEVYGGLSQNLLTTVTGISGNVLTTSSAHNLVPGQPIYALEELNEIDTTTIYYVLTAPTSTTFTITNTKGGSTMSLTNAGSLALQFRTATLLATVPAPVRSFVDTVVNEGTGRVEKYYWVRHKVVK